MEALSGLGRELVLRGTPQVIGQERMFPIQLQKMSLWFRQALMRLLLIVIVWVA